MRLGEWQTHVRLLNPITVLQLFHGNDETVSPDRLTKIVRHLAQTFSREYVFFIKKANPGHFFVHFRSFQTTIEFLQQMYVKNVHPGYGAGIRTHDLWNVSLFPTLSRDKLASLANVFFNNGPFSASFLYFSSFQCS